MGTRLNFGYYSYLIVYKYYDSINVFCIAIILIDGFPTRCLFKN